MVQYYQEGVPISVTMKLETWLQGWKLTREKEKTTFLVELFIFLTSLMFASGIKTLKNTNDQNPAVRVQM